MQVSLSPSDKEIEEFQQKFYGYFKTGYDFEEFLKEYLLKMGLDEVEVTQRSRDGGVDLKAIRKGVGDFSEVDVTHYYIQAKRYNLNHKVSVRDIRELKGTMPFGYKGMFITTSFFTKDAVDESGNDPSKLVVTVDGKALVTSCIDHGIGFLFKPIFSISQMNSFFHKDKKNNVLSDDSKNYIEKTITSNDIRARIVSIPSSIINQFEESQDSVDVKVNDEKTYHFSINRSRNYFGGVTTFFKDYNMILDEGVIAPKQCKWLYNKEDLTVYLHIEE